MKKLAFILLAVPLLWGCSKKTVTVVQSRMIFAEIEPGTMEVEILTEPSTDPASSTACVYYENIRVTLPVLVSSPGKVIFRDYPPSSVAGLRCSLEVSTPFGSSRGAVGIPQYGTMHQPKDDILPWGDIWFAWSRSQGSWFVFTLQYHAYDTVGNLLGTADTQFIAADTNAIIRLAHLQKYPKSFSLSAMAWIASYQGPRPGEAGNLSGAIRGYLLGSGYGGGKGFCVGAPPPGHRTGPPPRVDGEKRRRFLRRAFGVG